MTLREALSQIPDPGPATGSTPFGASWPSSWWLFFPAWTP